MNRKEKIIAWAGVTTGSIAGTAIGYCLYSFPPFRIVTAFIAIFCILAMAVPVIKVLIEIRNEGRRNAYRSFPGNFGFDKKYEK